MSKQCWNWGMEMARLVVVAFAPGATAHSDGHCVRDAFQAPLDSYNPLKSRPTDFHTAMQIKCHPITLKQICDQMPHMHT